MHMAHMCELELARPKSYPASIDICSVPLLVVVVLMRPLFPQ